MHHASRILTLAASLAMATLSASALAQTTVVAKSICQDVGTPTREPVGDRDGHAISASQYSCRNEGGPTDGTIMTGGGVWEWDKGAAALLTGNGVVRKPGALAVYQNDGGKVSLTMTDGKVTGYSGTSKGIYKTATGSLASLAGKSFTSTFRTIGGGQVLIESTMD